MTTTPPAGPHPGTLLVVDDDPATLEVLRAALAADGYRVLAASSVGQAADLLRAFRMQLILTDAFRGHADPDPWANLDLLRERAGETPVVILSGHSARSFHGYAARGFAGVIVKPFDIDELNGVIRQTIDRDLEARTPRMLTGN